MSSDTNNVYLLNTIEKKKVIELLESKDACIRQLETELENNKCLASEIHEQLTRTQELLQQAELSTGQEYQIQLENSSRQLAEYQNILQNLREDNDHLRAEVKQRKSGEQAARDDLEDARRRIQYLEMELIQTSSSQHMKSVTETRSLSKDLFVAKQTIADQQKKIQELELLSDQNKSQNISLKDRISKYEQIINTTTVDHRVKSLEQKQKQSEELVANLLEQISALEKQLAQKDNSMNVLNETIDALKGKQEIRLQLVAMTERVNQHLSKETELQNTIKSLEGNVQQLHLNYARSLNELDAQEARINKLESQRVYHENIISLQKQEIEAMHSEIEVKDNELFNSKALARKNEQLYEQQLEDTKHVINQLSTQRDKHLKSLEEEREQQKALVQHLKDELLQFKGVQDHQRKYVDELDKSRLIIDRMNWEQDLLKTKLQNVESILTRTLDEKDIADRKVISLQNNLNSIEITSTMHLQNEIVLLKHQIHVLSAQLEDTTMEAMKFERSLSFQKAENSRLIKKLHSIDAEPREPMRQLLQINENSQEDSEDTENISLVSKNQRLLADVMRLENLLLHERSQVSTLQEQVTQLKQQYDGESVLKALRDQQRDMEQKLEADIQKLQNQFEEERQHLQSKLEEEQKLRYEQLIKLEPAQKNLENIQRLEDENTFLREKITELSTRKTLLEEEAEVNQQAIEINSLKKQNRELAAELAEERMKAKVALEELNGRIDLLIKAQTKIHEKYKKRTKKIATMKLLLAKKEAELQEKERTIRNLKDHQEDIGKNLEEFKRIIEEKVIEADETKEQNINDLIKEQYNTQRLHQLVNEMRRKNDELELQLSRTKELEGQLQEKQQEISKLSSEKAEVTSKLKESRGYILKLRQEIVATKTDLNKRVNALEKSIEEKDRAHAKQVSDLETKMSDLEQKAREMQEIHEESKALVESIQKEKSELTTKLKDLQAKKKDEISDLKKTLKSENAKLRESEESLMLEKEKLLSKLRDTENSVHKIELERDSLINEHEEIVTSLKAQLAKLSESDMKYNMTKSGLISAKGERDDLLKILLEKDHLISDMKEKITSLNNRLKEEKKQAKEEKDFLKNQLQKAEKNAYTEDEWTKMQNNISNLKKTLKLAQDDNARKSQLIMTLRSEKDEELNNLQKMEDIVQSVKDYEERFRKAMKEIQRKDALIKDYKTKVATLEEVISDIKQQSNSLKSRIKEQHKKDTMTKELSATNQKAIEALKIAQEDLERAKCTMEQKDLQLKNYRQKLEKLQKDDRLTKLLLEIAKSQLGRIQQLSDEIEAHDKKQAALHEQIPATPDPNVAIPLSLLNLTPSEFNDIMNCTKAGPTPSRVSTSSSNSNFELRLHALQQALQSSSPNVQDAQKEIVALIQQRVKMELWAEQRKLGI